VTVVAMRATTDTRPDKRLPLELSDRPAVAVRES
jgi:hypothetical protein